MYILYKFGTQVLPEGMPTEDVGTGKYAIASFPLSSGGAFDVLGSDEARRVGPLTVSKKALFHENDAEAGREYFEALRAWVGKRAKLYRRWDDGTIEWVWARLEDVSSSRSPEHENYLSVALKFIIFSAHWQGESHRVWYFDSGEYFDTGLCFDQEPVSVILDSSPKTFTVTTSGNAIVSDVVLRLTAGSFAISAVEIKNNTSGHKAELVFDGSIASGQMLEIDCGNLSVENNGADAEADFEIGASHAIEEWFRLAVGENELIITITGGGADSEFSVDYVEGKK